MRFSEAATVFAVSRGTIYRWCDRQVLERVQLPNGDARVTVRSVEALLRSLGIRS
jgi:hypothetical protein